MVLNKKKLFSFNKEFIKIYDEDSNKEYILEVDVEYPKYSLDLNSDLLFLRQRMKINKYSKFVFNLYEKANYVVHKRALK